MGGDGFHHFADVILIRYVHFQFFITIVELKVIVHNENMIRMGVFVYPLALWRQEWGKPLR
jgi:hypothetical protein